MTDRSTTRTPLLETEPLEDELAQLEREIDHAEERLHAAKCGDGPTAIRAAVLRGDVRRRVTSRDQLAYAISRLSVPDAS